MSEQTSIVPLNLPLTQPQLRRSATGVAEILDPLRNRWLVLTPEEWVRQQFTAWLRSSKGYPASLMANEVSLNFNGMSRRCDTLVYGRNLRPIAIVEYKAPSVALTQRVFDQIARYNMVIQARALMVTNGISHYACRYDGEGYRFLSAIPDYSEI